MNLSKFASRKLLVTVASISLVVAAELLGSPLSAEALDTIQAIVMALVGSQGLVDATSAWKTGTDLAGIVDALTPAAPSPEPTTPETP